jgi:hypothetical protein
MSDSTLLLTGIVIGAASVGSLFSWALAELATWGRS